MSGTLNKVMLIGYLGSEVRLHYFEKNKCVGRFSLATHQSYIDKNTKEKMTHTQWHCIVVKDQLAETCEKYLRKGDKIYCEGSIKNAWAGNENQYSKTEIMVHQIQFLNTKTPPQKESI